MNRTTPCRGCGARITFRKTPRGAWQPINIDGSSHWATCKQRQRGEILPGKSIKIRDPSSGDVTTFAATTKNQKIRIAIDAERPIAGAKYRPASGQCRCDLPPWEACSGCPDLIRVQASSEPGEAA